MSARHDAVRAKGLPTGCASERTDGLPQHRRGLAASELPAALDRNAVLQQRRLDGSDRAQLAGAGNHWVGGDARTRQLLPGRAHPGADLAGGCGSRSFRATAADDGQPGIRHGARLLAGAAGRDRAGQHLGDPRHCGGTRSNGRLQPTSPPLAGVRDRAARRTAVSYRTEFPDLQSYQGDRALCWRDSSLRRLARRRVSR